MTIIENRARYERTKNRPLREIDQLEGAPMPTRIGLVVVAVASGAGFAFLVVQRVHRGAGVLAALAACLTVTAGIGLHHVRHRSRLSAEASGATPSALRRLPSGYLVIEDGTEPASKRRTDCILIGPAGVFVVSTRSAHGRAMMRRGELWVDGWRRTDIIDRAARRAAALLALFAREPKIRSVTPIICLENTQMRRRGFTAGGVAVVPPRRLRALVERGGAILDPADLPRLRLLATLTRR